MFKRFSVEEHVSSNSKVKSSQQRSIRSKILDEYPLLEPIMELILPKKAPMVVAKWCVALRLVLPDPRRLVLLRVRSLALLTRCPYANRSHNHIQLVLHEGEPMFFNQRDGPFMPTLKLLHRGPHRPSPARVVGT